MKTILLAFIVFFITFASFGQNIILEPLFIQRNRYANSLKDQEYFSFQDDNLYSSFSLEEAADYSSSIDLKKRSGFGIQQDVSLRGSIFEDTTITLQGVKINDPQTGHFNLELPLTTADLSRLDIIKNSQVISYSLKKPLSKGGLVRVGWGQHALWEKLLSFNFEAANIKNRLSVEHKISSGARQDRDFEIYNFSSHSLFESEAVDSEFLFGSTIRDFGAANFYSNAFAHQQEHITQQFYLSRTTLKRDYFDFTLTPYFRRHSDKFILNRHDPDFFTNNHKTYVYGLQNDFDFSNKTFISFDAVRETIDSSNLGKHNRLRKGLSFGIREMRLRDFIFDFSAGVDYYQPWRYVENGHLGLGYYLSDKLKLRFSYDRIWRPPSFTELYYLSPANIGNSELNLQRSNNYEAGLDIFANKNTNFSLSFFTRDQENTIDWVKNIPGDPWQAKNVGSLKAQGLDLYFNRTFDSFFNKLNIGYTYLRLDKKSSYDFSKYVFDYNRHKAVSNFGFDFNGISFEAIVMFSKPIERKNYTSVDIKVSKKIGAVTASIEGSNIFNTSYYELEDIPAAGRWYKFSLSYLF